MKNLIFTLTVILLTTTYALGANLRGIVRDKATLTPVVGAVVTISGRSTATDVDGKFIITNITKAPYTLSAQFIGYQTRTIELNNDAPVEILLEVEAIRIGSATVTAKRGRSNEAAMMSVLRESNMVAVGVSGVQIAKSSDSDAGEAVRRIPGVSLIDGRFIVVRGLSQRYNNVWLNGGGVPSSEADGRAFSFDAIPSSNIENIIVTKSYSAELPGDFCGGFIQISTKGTPEQSSVQISVGSGFNTQTNFTNARLGASSATDWLGFDASTRTLGKNIPYHLGTVSNANQLTDIYKTGFNNDWSIRTFRPMPDLKASLQWNARVGRDVGMVLSVNYQNGFKSVLDMVNRRYGVWNAQSDKPTLEKNYTDNQYNHEVKAGLMNNWIFRLSPTDRIEFRNLLNLIGKNRLTERYGLSMVSGDYAEQQTEFLYSSRLTYTGQLAGYHTFPADRTNNIDWNASYSYANRNEPDRRIVSNLGPVPSDGQVSPSTPTYNDQIKRYYQTLDDHILSSSVNYKKQFNGNDQFRPTLKAGLYGEYRNRDYAPREFVYKYDRLPVDIRQQYIHLPFQDIVNPESMASDKVYLDEVGKKTNAYKGDYSVAAAYVSATMPVGQFTFDLGLRAEQWNSSISYDRSIDPTQKLMTTKSYDEFSLLPAVNIAYKAHPKHILRASYGRTVNRPELRELSPAVYYDFDLFAEVQGNTNLKMATIDNVDLRYEFYPSAGEIVSIGGFYKNFINPIEWNFTDMGGSYRYSYENAKGAYVLGLEVDVRKNFDFIGLPELAFVFNGALVASRVSFSQAELVKQKDRALQGQSPYIVNTGLYYTSSDKVGFSASVLYNIIGPRIMGIGRSTSFDPNSDYDVPDSYEMPRSLLDITVAQKFARRFEVKLGAKNVLNEPIEIKQFPTTTIDGVQHSREQLIRKLYPGVSVSVALSVKF